jgi:uracil-DNA glycosylase
MLATDKKNVYTLLKRASDSLLGYASPEFSEPEPVFYDDISASSVSAGSPPASQAAPLSHFSEPVHEGLTFASIAQKIGSCTRCQLCRRRTNAVPGMGAERPAVLVVGEGPGAEEDMQGLPFVGPAGKLLDKMLAAICLDREQNCYIANIVKCRPPDNRTPLPEEADACISFLEAQIRLLKPKMILAAGRTAGQNLLKTDAPLSRLRGQFFDYNGIPLMVTYHPSALLRDESLKRPSWDDLKMFRARLEEIDPGYAAGFAKRS